MGLCAKQSIEIKEVSRSLTQVLISQRMELRLMLLEW